MKVRGSIARTPLVGEVSGNIALERCSLKAVKNDEIGISTHKGKPIDASPRATYATVRVQAVKLNAEHTGHTSEI